MFVGLVGGGRLIEILTDFREPINSKQPQVGKIIHCAKCLDFAAYKAGGSVKTVR